MATNTTGLQPCHLLYIPDRSTHLRFLVDTGAQVSVIPPSPSDRKYSHSTITLQAVNNTTIKTYGTHSLTINLGLRRTFRWVFVIADTETPILGADFLLYYSLTVDLTRRCLSDATTTLTVLNGASPSSWLLPRTPGNSYEALLAEFPALTQPSRMSASVKLNVTDHYRTPSPWPDPLFSTGAAESSTGQIRLHARARNYPTVSQQLGLPLTYDPQKDGR